MQRNNKPTPVSELVNVAAKSTNPVLRHAQELLAIQKILVKHLPEPINHHCRIANIHGDVLVISTDSPTWASKLRFKGPELLAILQRECNLHTIRSVRVKVHFSPPEPQTRLQPAKLSTTEKTTIRQLAQATTDADLSAFLTRLANRH